jgi:uncharacterized protein
MRAVLAEPRESPPEWARFVCEGKLHAGWSAPALAAVAEAGRHVWLGMVHDHGRVVAAFCGQRRGPLFECKLPVFVSPPGFAFLPELGVAERRAAVAAFERAVFRRFGWGCLGIAYRQVGPEDLDAVGGQRRARIGTNPAVWVENRWTSLDGYFAWLPRHRRQHFRQLYRRLSADPDLAIEIAPIAKSGVAGEEASRLAYLTLRRHHRRPKAPPPGYFDALAGQDGVLFLTYRDGGGRLLAFLLLFDDGSTLRCSVWGSLDPHGDGRPHLYFDYYVRVIAYAIEHRRSGVNLGKGMPETKLRFGGVLIPQQVVLAPR